MASVSAPEILKRIENKSVRVGIVGLGYVGLPLGLTFAERGYAVLGFDVDSRKIEALGKGESYIGHLDADRVAPVLKGERFQATTDFDRLATVDVIIVCVPTPLTRHREPEMRYVVETANAIRDRLQPGQLIIFESTTYPGTTDELILPILEESGLKCGKDFFLAYSPEREDPGNQRFNTATIPKVVGGVDAASRQLTAALYTAVVSAVVEVSSARVAEASKLTENIFRAINIALVNELKVVYDRMGIDVWEVLDAASTKPFGFMRFNPGPGWGGHCIPLDPFYLAWKAREFGTPTKFIELAGEVNIAMPGYVVDKLQGALNERQKSVRGSKVLVLGLAYKKDIDDPRESPAFEIIERLLHLGADVSYHDPYVPVAPSMRTWPDLPPMRSQPLTPEVVKAADAVMIVTDHSSVDYAAVAESAALVIDTRGVLREPRGNVVKA